MIPIIVLPAAEADIRYAIEFYEGARQGHGELFRLELDRILELIRFWPEGYERVGVKLRRACLSRFPYAVVYRLLPGAVRVVGVIPTRRDPAIMFRLGEDG